jgi:catalase (peroxidase I)
VRPPQNGMGLLAPEKVDTTGADSTWGLAAVKSNIPNITYTYKLYEDSVAYMANMTDAQKRDFAGGVLRLAFHDAAEWEGAEGIGGSDGCIDTSVRSNHGLEPVFEELDHNICDRFQPDISRADCWWFVAEVAVEQTGGPRMEWESFLFGRMQAQLQSGAQPIYAAARKHGSHAAPRHAVRPSPPMQPPVPWLICCWTAHLLWQVGACKTITDLNFTQHDLLPGTEIGFAEFKRIFLDRLKLTIEEAVALLGAHTVGHMACAHSGFHGTPRARLPPCRGF